MNCTIDFKMINEKGELEPGVGISVICDMYTLIWRERGFLSFDVVILLMNGRLWREFLSKDNVHLLFSHHSIKSMHLLL